MRGPSWLSGLRSLLFPTATGPPRVIRIAFILAAIAVASAPTSAQVIDPDLWGTNGTVRTIARSGNTLYIGGGFSSVGPCTGGGVPIDRGSGAPHRPFARVTGRVCAVVPDGWGGWFIGGRFSAVAGVPRSNLAHVLGDGSLAPWDPGVDGVGGYLRDPDPEFRAPGISALALVGNTLYLGGLFTTVGGQARNNIAAIHTTTGTLSAWNPDADGEVRCLAVQGSTVYAGGEFARIGGQPRNSVAALDARNGSATTWDPHAATPWRVATRVRALAAKGRTIYVGGVFDSIGGMARNSIAALDARTGQATAWDAKLGPPRRYVAHGNWDWPYVAALTVHENAVYAGGSFESADGQPRLGIAGFDVRSGAATDFAPAPSGGHVNALAVKGNTVYAGGSLLGIGGEIRPNIAALHGRTGRATSWNPRADGIIEALAVDGPTVYAGGWFTSIYDWQPRNGLAALDLVTGAVTPWQPNMGGYGVFSLGLIGNTVYLFGPFWSIDGQTRGNLAAVDATTGAVTPWNPGYLSANTYPIKATLATQDSTVYVAGWFDHLGGQPRAGFAALDGSTGAATTWDAGADALLGTALLPHGSTIYIGGDFRRIGGVERRSLAALDAGTATALPWNPGPSARFIGALGASGNSVFVGGTFSSMGGELRSDLAAVDATTGSVLPWNPDVGGDYSALNSLHVRALAISGNTVWAGGEFSAVGGRSRPYLAALDAVTGLPTSWEPHPDNVIHALAVSGDTLYVGGAFRSLGGLPRTGIAAVIWPRAGVPGKSRAAVSTVTSSNPGLTLARCRPNPVGSTGVIEFSLPAAGPVSVTIYDLQGRRVATLLDSESTAAGSHQIGLEAADWNTGVYFCRLEAAGSSLTKRLLVVR